MTLADGQPDPRPQLAASLDQVEREVDAIRPDDWSRATPCAAYDVRTLLAHLVAVLRKLTVVRDGRDMTGVADPADDLDSDEREFFRRARAALDGAWDSETALDARYVLPWGAMTGRELLDAYAHEFTVHAWDLSRATGGAHPLDPDLAEAALDWYRRHVPAEGRDGGPFGPPVPVPDDADAYVRLAAYVGRSA